MNPGYLLSLIAIVGAQVIHPRPSDRLHGRSGLPRYKTPPALKAVSGLASASGAFSYNVRIALKVPASRQKSICAPADIANMGLCEAVNCPVLDLIADIEQGAVFAHLVEPWRLLSEK